MTKAERRLLTAIAVAQSAEPELLDNYLYRLAMDIVQRGQLGEAISALAADLAALGVRFARPASLTQ